MAQLLTMLDLPVSLGGIVIGLITVVVRPGLHRADLLAATSLERVGVGLCVAVAALGLFGFGEATVRRGAELPPLAVLFTAMIFLLATPGFLWRTRWRGVGEGVATIAVSVAAILAGFSMGFLLVPLVILMITICIQALRQRAVNRSAGHPSVSSRDQ
ncbi:MAG TPA: hypothetical protein VM053_11165 [Gemmatimonadaceae bacterium]|nr:hypothetical protein [Gemmatimonadaceae bacterium]